MESQIKSALQNNKKRRSENNRIKYSRHKDEVAMINLKKWSSVLTLKH